MYADPQSVTVNAVAQSLYRTGSSLTGGRYALNDGSLRLSIDHSIGRRIQRKARLDNNKIVVDPLATDRNVPVSMSVYTVVDIPLTGYAIAEVKYQLFAHADWIKASTNADKLLGGEI